MDAVGIPRGGRELRAQSAIPHFSGVPDRDGITLPVSAIDIVVTPLVARALQCPCCFMTMPLGLCGLPVSSLLFSQFHLFVVLGFICL